MKSIDSIINLGVRQFGMGDFNRLQESEVLTEDTLVVVDEEGDKSNLEVYGLVGKGRLEYFGVIRGSKIPITPAMPGGTSRTAKSVLSQTDWYIINKPK